MKATGTAVRSSVPVRPAIILQFLVLFSWPPIGVAGLSPGLKEVAPGHWINAETVER